MTIKNGTSKNSAGRNIPAKKTKGDGKTNNYKLDGVNCINWRLGRD
jgi:hypothetical protein